MSQHQAFQESQRFEKPAVDFILIVILIVFGYVYFQQAILGEPVGSLPASNNGLIGGFITTLVALLILKSMRLKTKIDAEGIHYRVTPFYFSYRTIPWESVEEAYLRQYDALKEYGGYGIRFGFSGKGRAYTFGGNYGLQIQYEGRKLLVGTQDANAMEAALKRYQPSFN